MYIKFDEKTHTYKAENKKLISVTTYLNQFKKPFDADKIATNYPEKNNLIKKDVLEKCKNEADISKERGNIIHDAIELFLTKHQTTVNTSKYVEQKELENIYKYLLELLKEYKVVDCEKIIGSSELGIAGTFDCLMQNRKTGNLCLIDWKTNKEIKTENQWQNLLYPLYDLEDCDFNIYSLQLSIYKYIIEKFNLYSNNIEELKIVHIKNGIHEMEVEYLKEAVEKILIAGYCNFCNKEMLGVISTDNSTSCFACLTKLK